MEENKIMEEVKELIPEVVTEVQIEEDTTDGHPLVKVAIVGLAALGGAVGGYLFKRHRDRRWTKDFDSEGDEFYPEETEELDDDDSSEEEN